MSLFSEHIQATSSCVMTNNCDHQIWFLKVTLDISCKATWHFHVIVSTEDGDTLCIKCNIYDPLNIFLSCEAEFDTSKPQGEDSAQKLTGGPALEKILTP